MTSDFMQAIQTMTQEEWAAVKLQREIAENALNSSDNGEGDGTSEAVQMLFNWELV